MLSQRDQETIRLIVSEENKKMIINVVSPIKQQVDENTILIQGTKQEPKLGLVKKNEDHEERLAALEKRVIRVGGIIIGAGAVVQAVAWAATHYIH